MCKHYLIGLECPYTEKCSFAHGPHELKSKTLVPTNYKTVKCKQYIEAGYCQFGPRCQFLHKEDEAFNKLTRPTYLQMLNIQNAPQKTYLDNSKLPRILEKKLNLRRLKFPRLKVFGKLADSVDY